MFCDINSILFKVTKRSGIRKELRASECLRMFQEEVSRIIGNELAEKIRPLYIKDATITVASLSEHAVEKLALREPEIILRINRNMGDSFLHRIRYLS